jgi:fermentation-respiration switch protein FrsA (DUF1100 family)
VAASIPPGLEEGQRAPAIIIAHGFSLLKEQVLPDIAERFAAAGCVTLTFDYRYFGESEGEPRCQVFPLEMAEDYRNAITWLSDQPLVDPGANRHLGDFLQRGSGPVGRDFRQAC